MSTTHCPIQCIVPRHILRNIITETKSESQRERAWQTLHMSDEIEDSGRPPPYLRRWA